MAFFSFLFIFSLFSTFSEISFWAPKWHRIRIKIEHKMGTPNKRIYGLINKWVEFICSCFVLFSSIFLIQQPKSPFQHIASCNLIRKNESIQFNLKNILNHFIWLFYFFFFTKNIYCYKCPNWVYHISYSVVSTFKSAGYVTFSTLCIIICLYLETSNLNLVVCFVGQAMLNKT